MDAALKTRALRAAEDLEGAPAEEILGWAAEEFGSKLVVAASMAEAVLVDMLARIRSDIPVVFIDTGYHFAETIGTRDAVAATYDLPIISVRPQLTVAGQDAVHGADLYRTDPDLCCRMRKVVPLDRALAPYRAWAAGSRRAESAGRKNLKVVDWDARRGKVKIHPLVTWTDEDVERYVAEHNVIVNPLLSDGYESVGCWPCTQRGAGRAGRWAGSTKTECGIH
ncbi:(phospho)adenosine phosphosulfate reductase [Frankia canadensis]|uniref:Adenosine 5'-phosphosulfate reductase n=1 Tax=Frankia canadensis TaxID=1836972 RepID=A0A2I2KSP2_9ACTN|nr:phosphoadenylyl-sulfate reductase [Frankia canadensis]SNQ48659.1 (phospho)adenosine phosphosulfate reductase [Frankia canadensis]SOU55949.1 (phospho)adenosine phosphosulfate reductase [Frankia canadensis]